MVDYNFSGWATKNDIQCSDGRIIRKDAFKHHDGETVPLVWNHDHSDPYRVIGHAILEHRDEGVYAYGYFNETDLGQTAKIYVEHGDIRRMSICANQLKQQGPNVMHGCIREVSLVLAAANPGAFIENVIKHGEESDDEVMIHSGEDIILHHADDVESSDDSEINDSETGGAHNESDLEHSEEKGGEGVSENEPTIKDILDRYEAMNDDDKEVVDVMVGIALEEGDTDDEDENEVEHSEGGIETMKTNVFNNTETNDTLMHADILDNAIADIKRFGSLKESVMQHAAANNIENIADLLPAEKDLNMPPTWIKEDDSWVAKVMGAVHRTPFSRVRALFGQMDEVEARARGYIKKGEEKKDLKLAILKRTTSPTTVYIKMKMDRDDMIDIGSNNVGWIRSEMHNLLNKELAVAYLIGDGRDLSSDDKIDEQCIRPVLTDDEMYTINYTVTDGTDYHNDFNSASENDSEAKGIVRAAIKSRKGYKGSGTPTFFTTEDTLTELLLIEDQNGRRIYESIVSLATAMRVKEIVTVPELEAHTDVYGIIVNMNDYNTGADKGGEINMFDDFDIDYNQQKYLMETRRSGALVKPKSAIVLKKSAAVAG